ncbi:hypothetical protein, partial [Paucihalobacter sp.]|uniref:hypothetical protein n=1 Tax=Paucihalobacter sp. TaxID=2850405 RepID=UPI003D1608E5
LLSTKNLEIKLLSILFSIHLKTRLRKRSSNTIALITVFGTDLQSCLNQIADLQPDSTDLQSVPNTISKKFKPPNICI